MLFFYWLQKKKWKFSSEILNLTKLICKFISLFMFHLKIFLHRITFFMDILFQNHRTVAHCDEKNIYWFGFSMLNLRGRLSRMAGRRIHDLQNLGKSCWLITCKNVISVKLSNQLRHVSALFRSYRLRMTIKNKQGHPTTAFCKISVRRSKFYPEFFITWGRQKSFRWPSFRTCTISGAYLINSVRFSEV